MNSLPGNLKPLQRFAATVLLAAMVFQLGACPCGCVEHNAWAQLLDLDSGDHDHALIVAGQDAGLSSVTSSDTHDCTGEPRTQFVDNARGPRVHESSTPKTQLHLFVGAIAHSNSLAGLGTGYIELHLRLEVHAALCRPAMQVYRL